MLERHFLNQLLFLLVYFHNFASNLLVSLDQNRLELNANSDGVFLI